MRTDKEKVETLRKLIQRINTLRQQRKLAGELNRTWQLCGITDSGFTIAEIEAVTGSPTMKRFISPKMSTKETMFFLQGALLGMDNEADTDWIAEINQ